MGFSTALRLNYLRNQKGWTQEAVAAEVFLSRSYYGKIEAGNAVLPDEAISILSPLLGVPENFLQDIKENETLATKLNSTYQQILESSFPEQGDTSFLKQPIPHLAQELTARFLLAAIHYRQRDLESAKEMEEDYLRFFLPKMKQKRLPEHCQRAYLLYQYEKHYFQGDFSKSHDFCNQLIEAEEERYHQNIVNLKKVNLYLKQGDYPQAFTTLENTFQAIGRTSGSPLLAQAYIYQSTIYAYLKMFDYCLDNLNELEKNINENGLLRHRVVLAQHRGYVYSQKGELEKALSYYEEAASHPMTAERQVAMHISLVTLAIKMKASEIARKHLEAAKKLKLNEYEKVIFSSCEAEIYLLEGEEKLFLKLKREVIKYYEENNHNRSLLHNYLVLHNYYLEKKTSSKPSIICKKGKLACLITPKEAPMLFIGGIDAKQLEVGDFERVNCPHCQQNHPMTLYKSYYFFHFFFLPLFKWNVKYLVACHGCHTVMGIASEKGKALEKGEIHDLDAADLIIIQEGATKPLTCLNCGEAVDGSYRYCPNCGTKM